MSEYTILTRPHPFRTDRVETTIPVGKSLQCALGARCADNVHVSIEGEHIPREMWNRVKPKAGTAITVVRVPQGDTVKKIIAVVILVIIAIYAPQFIAWAAKFGTWAKVAAIGITMLATMAAYALIPPPEMPKLGGDGESFQRLNSLTGTSNNAMPYGSIPMVIGECVYFPPFAANPYTEILGDQQYLRAMFDLGYGDLVISDIKIGETPITSFSEVEYEVSYNPDLFSSDVFELSLADAFDNGAVVTKTSQANSNELSVDLVFGQGLFGVDDKGKTTRATTSFLFEYRLTGSVDPWVSVATLPATDRTISSGVCTVSGSNFQVSSAARKTIRLGIRWKVAQGQYDIRMTRNATTFGVGTQDNAKFDGAGIAVLRSIRTVNPSKTGTLKLAIRIKATDQLNGVVNKLSVLGQQKIRVYDSATSTWSAPVANFNPAWVYNWLLTDAEGVAVTVADSRVDLEMLEDFAADCVTKGFTCKGIIDRAISSGELLRMVLAAGRGSFSLRDGKYSVIFDKPQTTPIQHFSPTNSSSFSGNRVFVNRPHALRARFQNPEYGWQEDEIIVLDDDHSHEGLNARGVASALPAAEKFETLELPFVTSPTAAWQIARYHLGQGIFRPNIYSWDADVEHLICNRGDLVYRVDDVVEWGAGFGYISDVTRNGLNEVTTIHTAEPLYVEAGETYSIRVRTKDGQSHIRTVQAMTADTEVSSFVLTTVMPVLVDSGDLYILGKTTSEIRQLLITKIEPTYDMAASIQAVEYSTDVLTFDDNPPATFISSITGMPFLEPPPPPNIYAVFSDEAANNPDDGGTTDPTIDVGIDPGGGSLFNPGFTQLF